MISTLPLRTALTSNAGSPHRPIPGERHTPKAIMKRKGCDSNPRFLDGTHRPYVEFLGRLNWKKGLDRLIPAMAQVPNTDLSIAGNDEGDYRPELEALADRFGVLDPVYDDRKWGLLSVSGTAVVLGKLWERGFRGNGRGLSRNCDT